MQRQGYKAFCEDMTNVVGMKFEEGRSYHCPGPISFGIHGNGYHFCARLEDTLRYYPTLATEEDCTIKIAKVIGYGQIAEGSDDYNEYYDLYSASNIYISHILSREEIIAYATQLGELRLTRFVSTFKLQPEEVWLLQGRYIRTDLALSYYQLGKKDVYEEYYKGIKVYQLEHKKPSS